MNIPFYKNRGHRCAQAAIKSILGARQPEKRFTFEKLDQLTLHQDPEITLPTQIAYGFHQLQVPFEYYVKPGKLSIAQLPSAQKYSNKFYGPRVTSNINFQALKKASREIQGSKCIITSRNKPSIEMLEEMIKQEKIPLCLVNWDIFLGRKNNLTGHYIIITRFENGQIIYHDNGPHKARANKRISKERFKKAWNLSTIDHDLIVA